MNKSMIIKGLGTAMAIGGTVAAISSTMSTGHAAKKKAKKTAAKAVKIMNSVIDGVEDMIG